MPDRDEHYSGCKDCGHDHTPTSQHKSKDGPYWSIFQCPESNNSWEHTTKVGMHENHKRGQPSPGNPTVGRTKDATFFGPLGKPLWPGHVSEIERRRHAREEERVMTAGGRAC